MNEKRYEDLAALFEKHFKEESKTVSAGLSTDAKRRYDGEWRPIFFIRFHPGWGMFLILILTIAATFLSVWYTRTLLPDATRDRWFVMWLNLAAQFLTLYVLWISGRATSHQSAQGRWQRIAERMIYIYESEGRSVKDIERGINIRLHFYNETLAYFLGIISCVTLYANLESKIVAVNQPWGSRLLTALHIPAVYSTTAFNAIFTLSLSALFLLVYAPRAWRKHLQTVLHQLLEKREEDSG